MSCINHLKTHVKYHKNHAQTNKNSFYMKIYVNHPKNCEAQHEKIMKIHMKNHVTARFIVCHFFPEKSCVDTIFSWDLTLKIMCQKV